MTLVNIKMKQRRGTLAAWQSANPILLDGELAVVTDSEIIVVGDGVTSFNDLLNEPTKIFATSNKINNDLVLPLGMTLSGLGSVVSGLGDDLAQEITDRGNADSALQSNIDAKQDELGFTPENVSNKQTDLTPSATKYPTVDAVNTGLSGKLDNTDAAVGSRINAASAATPLDTDLVATAASAGSLLKITWTNVKAFLKTYFDTLYQAVLVSGTNIKTYEGSSILGSGNFNPVVAVPLLTAGGAATLTNMNLAEAFLLGSNRHITRFDLTNYVEAKIICRVNVASTSVNNPRFYIRYRTVASGFTNTTNLYLTMGTSEIETSLTSAGCFDSGWISLVAGAKTDVYIALLTDGGDGAADPALGLATLYFR